MEYIPLPSPPEVSSSMCHTQGSVLHVHPTESAFDFLTSYLASSDPENVENDL
jgi:hypothetical protein